jgi:hypothetical protein
MIENKAIKGTVCLLIWSSLCFGTPSAASSRDQQRERLRYRLRIFSLYDQQKQYQKLYTLLAKEQREGYGSWEKFAEFKKHANQSGELLVSFSARSFLLASSRDYALIVGCGKYQRDNKTEYIESQVEAVYESGDWYFRSLVGVSAAFGTEPKKCR